MSEDRQNFGQKKKNNKLVFGLVLLLVFVVTIAGVLLLKKPAPKDEGDTALTPVEDGEESIFFEPTLFVDEDISYQEDIADEYERYREMKDEVAKPTEVTTPPKKPATNNSNSSNSSNDKGGASKKPSTKPSTSNPNKGGSSTGGKKPSSGGSEVKLPPVNVGGGKNPTVPKLPSGGGSQVVDKGEGNSGENSDGGSSGVGEGEGNGNSGEGTGNSGGGSDTGGSNNSGGGSGSEGGSNTGGSNSGGGSDTGGSDTGGSDTGGTGNVEVEVDDNKDIGFSDSGNFDPSESGSDEYGSYGPAGTPLKDLRLKELNIQLTGFKKKGDDTEFYFDVANKGSAPINLTRDNFYLNYFGDELAISASVSNGNIPAKSTGKVIYTTNLFKNENHVASTNIYFKFNGKEYPFPLVEKVAAFTDLKGPSSTSIDFQPDDAFEDGGMRYLRVGSSKVMYDFDEDGKLLHKVKAQVTGVTPTKNKTLGGYKVDDRGLIGLANLHLGNPTKSPMKVLAVESVTFLESGNVVQKYSVSDLGLKGVKGVPTTIKPGEKVNGFIPFAISKVGYPAEVSITVEVDGEKIMLTFSGLERYPLN